MQPGVMPGGPMPMPGGMPGRTARNAQKAESKEVAYVASQLWTPEFEERIQRQWDDARVSDHGAYFTVLAATIPTDSMRALLSKQLRKRWNDGPQALESAGLIDKVVTDPGLLVLVKMGKRKEAKQPKGGLGGPMGGVQPRPGRQPVAPPVAVPGRGGETAKATPQKKEQAEMDWMAASSRMVSALCKRFYAAAQARDKAAMEARKPILDLTNPKLPADFELSPEARVTAAYHLVWPEDAAAALGADKARRAGSLLYSRRRDQQAEEDFGLLREAGAGSRDRRPAAGQGPLDRQPAAPRGRGPPPLARRAGQEHLGQSRQRQE